MNTGNTSTKKRGSASGFVAALTWIVVIYMLAEAANGIW